MSDKHFTQIGIIDSKNPGFEAGYDYVESQVERADKMDGSYPMWYGWAIREAFWAGIKWQKDKEK